MKAEAVTSGTNNANLEAAQPVQTTTWYGRAFKQIMPASDEMVIVKSGSSLGCLSIIAIIIGAIVYGEGKEACEAPMPDCTTRIAGKWTMVGGAILMALVCCGLGTHRTYVIRKSGS